MELELAGEGLTLHLAGEILAGRVRRVVLGSAARKRVQKSRRCLEALLQGGATIYGVNTGFGKLAHARIGAHEILDLQENLLRSHAVGLGPHLDAGISRLALVLRIQALAKGYSGVTLELLDHLVELFNRGVVPAIPELGSVGASGDLAPLAHLGLVVIGEGRVLVGRGDSPLRPAATGPVLKRLGLEPYRLQAKEGLSLINGTQISTALLADAAVQAQHLARIADVAGSLTVEATKSSQKPFDERIGAVRPHPGQQASAANLRRLLAGSDIMASHADCNKVQDAYSLRCMPQVHGTFRDALAHVTRTVECEMNAATDNPLVFADDGEILSGGNFHGQAIALAADLLAAAAADLASISERRVENLVNPDLSGLPGFLTPRPGLNTGLMLVQVLAASLVSECKALAYPASVDSIPTSANREDHVSMSPAAARKCRWILGHVERVLACELLCAAQGLEFLQPLRAGRGAEAAYRLLRRHVRPLERDRILHPDLETVVQLIRDGSIRAAVARACGSLD